jgi:hypothetical protein
MSLLAYHLESMKGAALCHMPPEAVDEGRELPRIDLAAMTSIGAAMAMLILWMIQNEVMLNTQMEAIKGRQNQKLAASQTKMQKIRQQVQESFSEIYGLAEQHLGNEMFKQQLREGDYVYDWGGDDRNVLWSCWAGGNRDQFGIVEFSGGGISIGEEHGGVIDATHGRCGGEDGATDVGRRRVNDSGHGHCRGNGEGG